MMKITLSKASQNETVFVAFASTQSQGQQDRVSLSFPELEKRLAGSLKDKSISGKSSETTVFRDLDFHGHRHVVVVGLGELKKLKAEDFRQVAATVLGQVKALKASSAAVWFEKLTGNKKHLAAFVQAFAEGLGLSDYSFDELKSKKKDKKEDDSKALDIRLTLKSASEAAFGKALKEAEVLIETVNFSRRLGDLPGNLMTPTLLAETVQDAVKGTGIKCTVWDKARIKKEKMGGLLGVSNGSDQEPRFIILEYKGAAASKKPVVFVGKGLTFDTGGISIKPSAAMEEMKYDMCGGANVIGALLAIAKLKLKVNAYALIPATENMPGPSATKPGDVHFARNGKSFEVNNTDAEGRLILSDALCYASELKPQAIFDAATLTGAIVVALGNTHTGYFTRDQALAKRIESASEVTGEWLWRLPLTDHHVKDMKGTYADLSNISSSKGAGSATAAAFLEQFVEEGIPWAHFDIAGTAWAVGNRLPYCPKKGASGVMIRTFVELAKSYT